MNHSILLRKLEILGTRGIPSKWIKDFLSNRKQFVIFEGVESTRSTVIHGVPQGSTLSPLLFLLYVDDIVNISNLLRLVLFADDTTLSMLGHVLNDLCNSVSSELDRLQVWFNVNRLSLNLAKTHYMIFSGRKPVKNVEIKVNGYVLQQVNHTKFLGVIADDKLSWIKHIECVASKVAKATSVLYKAKFVLNKESTYDILRVNLSFINILCRNLGQHL